MGARWPKVLRTGAIIRVGSEESRQVGLGAQSSAYVDLSFKDGHVERWMHGAGIAEPEPGFDDPRVLVAWGKQVAEQQRYSLQWELRDSFYGVAERELETAPIEVVIEWNVDLRAT